MIWKPPADEPHSMGEHKSHRFHGAFRVDTGETLVLRLTTYTCVLHILVGILIMSANIFLLTVFVRTHSLRNVSCIIMMSLALADLCVGLTTLTPLVYAIFSDTLQQTHCDIIGYFFQVSWTVSLYTVLLLSLDRLVCIVNPFRYRRICQRGICLACIITAWIFSLGFWAFSVAGVGSFHLSPDELMCTFNVLRHPIKCVMDAVIIFLAPTVVTGTCYYRIWTVSHRHGKNLQRLRFPGTSTPRASQKALSPSTSRAWTNPTSLRALRTVMIIVGAFYVCWIPFVSHNIFQAVEGPKAEVPEWVHVTIHLLAITNSLWNPIIYMATNRNIRKASLRLLVACCPLRIRARFFERSLSGTYSFNLSGQSRVTFVQSPSFIQVESTRVCCQVDPTTEPVEKLCFRI